MQQDNTTENVTLFMKEREEKIIPCIFVIPNIISTKGQVNWLPKATIFTKKKPGTSTAWNPTIGLLYSLLSPIGKTATQQDNTTENVTLFVKGESGKNQLQHTAYRQRASVLCRARAGPLFLFQNRPRETRQHSFFKRVILNAKFILVTIVSLYTYYSVLQ